MFCPDSARGWFERVVRGFSGKNCAGARHRGGPRERQPVSEGTSRTTYMESETQLSQYFVVVLIPDETLLQEFRLIPQVLPARENVYCAGDETDPPGISQIDLKSPKGKGSAGSRVLSPLCLEMTTRATCTPLVL